MNIIKKLTRTKPLAVYKDQHESKDGLKKCLNAVDLTLLGIGAIIGTGIFVLSGVTAATAAGPGVAISFIISGVVCTLAALCYAELSSKIGGSGSAYGYSYATFGEFIGFLVAWMLILEYGIATAAVAVGWSGYFYDFFSSIGYPLPEQFSSGPFTKIGAIINLPAFLVILGLTYLLILGAKQSATLNAALVAIKVFAVIVFIVVAAFNIAPENWSPYLPYGWFDVLPDGSTVGVIAGASLVFFAYVGFDAVSTAAEESENPGRDVPIGIMASLIFCAITYVIVSMLMTGIVPYSELNVESPASHALNLIGFNITSAVISTAVVAGLVSVMLVLFYGLTRVLFALARDGLLPSALSKVSPRTKTPARTITAAGVVMALLAGFLPFGRLVEIVNIGTLAAFVFVCLAVILMRVKYPEVKGGFEIPGKLTIPILGALSCFGLILSLPQHTIGIFAAWMLVGLIIYFAYSISASKLNT